MLRVAANALSRATLPGHARAMAAAVAVPAHARTASSVRRRRRRSSLPTNTGINFVPQQEAWVVERFGKFHDVLTPGLQLLVPIIDQIRYVHSLKEIVLEIPSQSAITQDNVTIHLDGVLYVRIVDAYAASYGVEDPEFAVSQLAQTTMRSELGKLTLDTVFKERGLLNEAIVDAINQAAQPWGLSCLRCEIRDIMLPDKVIEDMQRQVSAERKKRAAILDSEGMREAAINEAEGRKRAVILASEARRLEQTNNALGEAAAIRARAEATAAAIDMTSKSIKQTGGTDAVALSIAQQYVDAFGKLAKTNNTMLLPSNLSDPASMVAQATAIFDQVRKQNPTRLAAGMVDAEQVLPKPPTS